MDTATFNFYEFDRQRSSSDDDDETESDSSLDTIINDTDDIVKEEMIENLWCKCERCGVPSNIKERKCCLDDSRIQQTLAEENIVCITEHPDFRVLCMNIAVLKLAFYQYCEDSGYRPEPSDIHRKYRYIAYRQFARWIYQRLGRIKRIILPACAVKEIRQTFPSEEYTGFKYPRIQYK